MSARRLVLVAAPDENAVPSDGDKHTSLPGLVRVYTPDEARTLREEFSPILAKYEKMCEKHTRLNEKVRNGKASEEEMDAFHEGEFKKAEEAYQAFLDMVYPQPPEIHAVIFDW